MGMSVFRSVYKKNPILMFCFNQNFQSDLFCFNQKSVGFFGLNTICISGEEMALEDSQLLCPIWGEIVEQFSISFDDIHIQIMVGDDANAVTGNVGSAQRIAESDGMKGDGRMPKDVMSFSLWIHGFFCEAFDELMV